MIKIVKNVKLIILCTNNISLTDISNYLEETCSQSTQIITINNNLIRWIQNNGKIDHNIPIINQYYIDTFFKLTNLSDQQKQIFSQVTKQLFRGINIKDLKDLYNKFQSDLAYLIDNKYIIRDLNNYLYNFKLASQFELSIFSLVKELNFVEQLKRINELQQLKQQIFDLLSRNKPLVTFKNLIAYFTKAQNQNVTELINQLRKYNEVNQNIFLRQKYCFINNSQSFIKANFNELSPLYTLPFHNYETRLQILRDKCIQSKNLSIANQYLGCQSNFLQNFIQKNKEQQTTINIPIKQNYLSIYDIQKLIQQNRDITFEQFYLIVLIYQATYKKSLKLDILYNLINQQLQLQYNNSSLSFNINLAINFLVENNILKKIIDNEKTIIQCNLYQQICTKSILNINSESFSQIQSISEDSFYQSHYFIENKVERSLFLLDTLSSIHSNNISYQNNFKNGCFILEYSIMYFTVRQLMKLIKHFGIQFSLFIKLIQDQQLLDKQLNNLDQSIQLQLVGNKQSFSKIKQTLSFILKELHLCGFVNEISLIDAIIQQNLIIINHKYANKIAYQLNIPFELNIETLSDVFFDDNGVVFYFKDLDYIKYNVDTYFASIFYSFDIQNFMVPFILVQDFLKRLKMFTKCEIPHFLKFYQNKPELDQSVLMQISIDQQHQQIEQRIQNLTQQYEIPTLNQLIVIHKFIKHQENIILDIHLLFDIFVEQQQLYYSLDQFATYTIYSIINFNIIQKIIVFNGLRLVPYSLLDLKISHPDYVYQKRKPSTKKIRQEQIDLNIIQQQNIQRTSKEQISSQKLNKQFFQDFRKFKFSQSFDILVQYNKIIQLYMHQNEIFDPVIRDFCQDNQLVENDIIKRLYTYQAEDFNIIQFSISDLVQNVDEQQEELKMLKEFDQYPFSTDFIQVESHIIKNQQQLLENSLLSSEYDDILQQYPLKKSYFSKINFFTQVDQNQLKYNISTHIYPSKDYLHNQTDSLLANFIQLCKNQNQINTLIQLDQQLNAQNQIKPSQLTTRQLFLTKLGYFLFQFNTNELYLTNRNQKQQIFNFDEKLVTQTRNDVYTHIYLHPGTTISSTYAAFHPLIPSFVVKIINSLILDDFVELRNNLNHHSPNCLLSGTLQEDNFTLSTTLSLNLPLPQIW